MIKVSNNIIKKQENFWNHCLFHPTDAVEDSWGKRILDRMAEDKAVKTIRIYTMFEDIVYIDMNGKLCYDFRANDLRLDYLIEKGYDLLLAFAAMPDCIAKSSKNKTSVSFNKTRYKGKMFNTSIPKDYAIWEIVCYEYTKHIVERYGIERVSKWRMQCFNEADIRDFFMSELPPEAIKERLAEYCKLYKAFEKGITRVSKEIKIGGPALALHIEEFLMPWLDYVKENNLKLDFISYHNYGCLGFYDAAQLGLNALNVDNHFNKHKRLVNAVTKCGFEHLPIIVDEWGAVGGGFKNITQVPELVFRETEVFSAYFAKLICKYINSDYIVEKLMICLSGQHELTEEFTGFRGFFTLNALEKPIYNAFVLAAKLKENILSSTVENENIFVIPTVDDKNNLSVLVSYSDDDFSEKLPEKTETLNFESDITGKKVTIWCIDKTHTNPFRLNQKLGENVQSEEAFDLLRQEGKLKPIAEYTAKEKENITLKFTANSYFLITIE
jgi:xylan 1,4-beta-xylosidase